MNVTNLPQAPAVYSQTWANQLIAALKANFGLCVGGATITQVVWTDPTGKSWKMSIEPVTGVIDTTPL